VTQYVVPNGHTSTLDLHAGDLMIIEGGGTSLDTIEEGGAIEIASSGGKVSSGVVEKAERCGSAAAPSPAVSPFSPEAPSM
jgi:hypothetical protein